MTETEKEKKQYVKPIQKAKKPPPSEPVRVTKPEGEQTPKRLFIEEIKKEPPLEPTRKIKPKEEKRRIAVEIAEKEAKESN